MHVYSLFFINMIKPNQLPFQVLQTDFKPLRFPFFNSDLKILHRILKI